MIETMIGAVFGLFFAILLLIVAILGIVFVVAFLIGLGQGVQARKWRKVAKPGDDCRFKNLLGTWTDCTIEKIDGDQALIKNTNMSQWMELNELYPA